MEIRASVEQHSSAEGRLRGIIAFALIQQALVLTMAAAILDGGDLFRVCRLGAIGHWVGIGTVPMAAKKDGPDG
jgi:hypothetical protein